MSTVGNNPIKLTLYSNEHHREITLAFSPMQTNMRDVTFYVSIYLLMSVLTFIAQATVYLVSSEKDKTPVLTIKVTRTSFPSASRSTASFIRHLNNSLSRSSRSRSKRQQGLTTCIGYMDGQLVGIKILRPSLKFWAILRCYKMCIESYFSSNHHTEF